MRNMLATLAVLVALVVPAQVTSAAITRVGETHEMNYQVFERMATTEMKLSEAMMMLMKTRDKMSPARMQRIMNMIDDIDTRIKKLIEAIGTEG